MIDLQPRGEVASGSQTGRFIQRDSFKDTFYNIRKQFSVIMTFYSLHKFSFVPIYHLLKLLLNRKCFS